MKENAWVVVANGSLARIFASNTHNSLQELEVIEHPATRVHGRDLVTSRPGRSFDSKGTGRHSLESELTPQRNEALQFATHLAQHLDHGRRTNAFTKLYLIVSPTFLGLLRGAMDPHIRGLIKLEVDKDATSKSPEEIKSYLPIWL